jgi:hypothetical protein
VHPADVMATLAATCFLCAAAAFAAAEKAGEVILDREAYIEGAGDPIRIEPPAVIRACADPATNAVYILPMGTADLIVASPCVGLFGSGFE